MRTESGRTVQRDIPPSTVHVPDTNLARGNHGVSIMWNTVRSNVNPESFERNFDQRIEVGGNNMNGTNVGIGPFLSLANDILHPMRQPVHTPWQRPVVKFLLKLAAGIPLRIGRSAQLRPRMALMTATFLRTRSLARRGDRA